MGLVPWVVSGVNGLITDPIGGYKGVLLVDKLDRLKPDRLGSAQSGRSCTQENGESMELLLSSLEGQIIQCWLPASCRLPTKPTKGGSSAPCPPLFYSADNYDHTPSFRPYRPRNGAR
jgi:hypothetical protein